MIDVRPGALVIISLQSPREKMWGVLVRLMTAGVILRGVDLEIFEEWALQEASGGDPMLGPTTVFLPMTRLERVEVDETVGPVPSYCSRFESSTRRRALDALGWDGALSGATFAGSGE
jgi:hypothetical protein